MPVNHTDEVNGLKESNAKNKLKIKRKDGCDDLPLPGYMSQAASGMDLYAAVENQTVVEINEIKLIPTGIFIALPFGYEAQVRPRSGLALKFGITLVNSPGTIDSDYRGEIGIILSNHGKDKFVIRKRYAYSTISGSTCCSC